MVRISTSALALSIGFFALVAISIFVFAKTPEHAGLQQILPFAIGFLGYQAVQFLYVTFAASTRNGVVKFDPAVIELAEEEMRDVSGQGRDRKLEKYVEDLNLFALAGRDKSLALAQLRMEIERSLRDIADAYDLRLSSHNAHSITRLARTLIEQDILSANLYEAIGEVANVCNQAVHGYEIGDRQTEQIVTAGEDILVYLHRLKTQGEAPVE